MNNINNKLDYNYIINNPNEIIIYHYDKKYLNKQEFHHLKNNTLLKM